MRQGIELAMLLLVASGLTACQGPPQGYPTPDPATACPPPQAAMFGAYPALPREAYTGVPQPPFGPPMGPPGMEAGVPLPAAAAGPWAPPGISQPWPQDEYLADGGVHPEGVSVGVQGELRGMQPEDAVAHFDTLDGRTLVEPSNRVFIYSPRFGAVRQVVSLRADEQHEGSAGMHLPTKLVRHDELKIAATDKQNLQLVGQNSRDVLTVFRSKQGDGMLSQAVGPTSFQDAFLPYENFAVLKMGAYNSSEMAFLAQGALAAVTWTNKQAVQIILDRTRATEAVSDQAVESVYTVNEPPARPRLRLIKVASTQYANPGDTLDFTLRFDNVGNQPIGNVTIIDDLTARLEYVPGSAQCSVAAGFSSGRSASGSLVLRWEVTNPLKPGDGGVARFQCRVR